MVRTGRRRQISRANATRMPLFAEPPEDVGELRLVVRVHDLHGAQALAAIHAHVERRIGPEREAARAVVQLTRRHSEVQQQTGDSPDVQRRQLGRKRSERRVHEGQARTERGEALTRRVDRLCIAINTDQTPVPGEMLADLLCVAAAADGAVNVRPGIRKCSGTQPLLHKEPERGTLLISAGPAGRRPRTVPPGWRGTARTPRDSRVRSVRGRRGSTRRSRCPRTAATPGAR